MAFNKLSKAAIKKVMKIRHKNEQRAVTPKFNSNNIDKKKEVEKQTVF